MIIGLVGKANCGKSTFFKASTLAEVAIAPYPFTTIAKNEGVAFVKIKCVEKEFNTKCQPRFGYCIDGNRFVPVELLDVAGLVPGAHKGRGRGNQFLDDLRQADAFIHIIDISGSTNENGEIIEPLTYDPINDIKFIETELDMWYLQILKKGWEKFSRQVKQENLDIKKALAKQLSGLKINEELVEELIKKLNLSKDPTIWKENELLELASELRKRTKPMIIAANKIDIEGSEENFENLKKEFKDYIIMPCSAESELALKEATKHRLIEYIPENNDFKILDKSRLNEKQINGLEFIKNLLKKYNTTGVQETLDKAVFSLLNYIAVFPVANNKLEDSSGNKLPDCFLVNKDITALEFAFKVHTDIGNNFIRAVDLKTKQIIGKDHKLKHLDVIEIITR